jgi:phosphonoacetaldehyde hydrolase
MSASDNLNLSRYTGPLRAVILDWAGTTVDFGSLAPVRAIVEAFRRCEVPISIGEARGPMGKAKRDHLAALLESPEIRGRWETVYGSVPTDSDVDDIYLRFLPLQRELIVAHAELIPGCLATVEACRQRGLKIGSTTGYTRALLDALAPLARQQGFEPEASVVADDVPSGRPAPWMCLECALRLDVYPPAACIVVDDTTVGIEAGINAGMWTVGVVQSGNLVGLSRDEFHALDSAEAESLCTAARRQLNAAGAHYTIDTIADLPALFDEVEARLKGVERASQSSRLD